MTAFSDTLIDWYNSNKRDLPWRHTQNPYYVWLSEIILQQTRVEQGMPYYLSFVSNYPTVDALAKANLDDVLKLWQGLGYYSRARNLHAAAIEIVINYDGKFPNNYKDLVKLKGVGDYTASAIASFCFKEVKPVLDGNVYRFISRYLGIPSEINTPKAHKEFKEVLNEFIPHNNPDIFNQAIMEFGAVNCKPKLALCDTCVFNEKCFAFNNNSVDSFPVKAKSKKSKDRYFNYLVVIYKNKTYLTKREDKDIWNNLYEFPLIESKEMYDKESFIGAETIKVSKVYKHILSHQNIWAKFYYLNHKPDSIDGMAINRSELSKFPIHRLLDKFLNETDWLNN